MLACASVVFAGTMKTTGATPLTICTGKQVMSICHHESHAKCKFEDVKISYASGVSQKHGMECQEIVL